MKIYVAKFNNVTRAHTVLGWEDNAFCRHHLPHQCQPCSALQMFAVHINNFAKLKIDNPILWKSSKGRRHKEREINSNCDNMATLPLGNFKLEFFMPHCKLGGPSSLASQCEPWPVNCSQEATQAGQIAVLGPNSKCWFMSLTSKTLCSLGPGYLKNPFILPAHYVHPENASSVSHCW